MFDLKQCDELAKKLFDALPKAMHTMEEGLQQQFKEILELAFSRLDLVTREEFDVQVKVLARSREKIDQLEQQLQMLLEK